MRRLLALTLAVLIPLSTPALALCTGDSAFDRLPATDQIRLQEKAAQVPYHQGLLWQASKGARQITVMGTMHLYDPRLQGIMDQLEPMIAGADRLFLEMTAEDEAAFQVKMLADPALFVIAQGPGLDELLSPESWLALTNTLTLMPELGMPPEIAARMKPWLLGIMLSVPSCVLDSMRAGQAGLDRMIGARAQALDLPMVSLDDGDKMLALLAGDPLEDQIEDFDLAMRMLDHDPAQMVATIEHYFDQSFRLNWEYSLDHARARTTDPDQRAWLDSLLVEMEDELLTQRNADWMQVLLTDDSQRAFVAVGAAHLAGFGGVLDLLEQDGWTLSRLPLQVE